jgi:1,4-dihydroxy-2-naphthoate octaprenyltransferase
MVCFGVGMVCGILLTWMCGWTILLIGVPAVIAGYSYAGPPLRPGYRGPGVVTVFLFMGPVMVVGSYFVMTLHVSAGALAASVPLGLLAAGVMHTDDLRDYASDV